MARAAEEHQPVLLEKVIRLINRKFESEQAATVSDFARFFYGSIAAEDFNDRKANELYASVLSLWNFIQSASQNDQRVQVFNPEIDTVGWHSSYTVIEVVHPDMPFLVDSVRMELHRLGLGIHLHIHLPMAIKTDDKGAICSLEMDP